MSSSSVLVLVQDARALHDAEQLAQRSGQPEAAALLAESCRLTLARLLRCFPEHASRDADGQVWVAGAGVVGTLTSAEAEAAGAMR